MKSFITFTFVVAVVSCLGGAVQSSPAAAESKKSDSAISAATVSADSASAALTAKDEKKIYKRLIPADVLRDFPGMCFASTRCATIEPGQTWELTPFCGRSTCVVNKENPNMLLELVEDCGPLPINKEKCKLDAEQFNKTASFPDCCPVFKCEDGVTLEYPDIKPDAKPN